MSSSKSKLAVGFMAVLLAVTMVVTGICVRNASPAVSASAETTNVEKKIYTGDVDRDGTVTITDARTCLRISIKLDNYAETDPEYLMSDYDCDGIVTISDARKILRTSIGLEEKYEYGVNSEESTTKKEESTTAELTEATQTGSRFYFGYLETYGKVGSYYWMEDDCRTCNLISSNKISTLPAGTHYFRYDGNGKVTCYSVKAKTTVPTTEATVVENKRSGDNDGDGYCDVCGKFTCIRDAKGSILPYMVAPYGGCDALACNWTCKNCGAKVSAWTCHTCPASKQISPIPTSYVAEK